MQSVMHGGPVSSRRDASQDNIVSHIETPQTHLAVLLTAGAPENYEVGGKFPSASYTTEVNTEVYSHKMHYSKNTITILKKIRK